MILFYTSKEYLLGEKVCMIREHSVQRRFIICYFIVRLVGGGSKTYPQGRAEVFFNGSWGTVCDDGWDLKDANVVCRELGFPEALTASKAAAFGAGQGKIWMENVQCVGDESSLTECNHQGWGKGNCSHSEDAGAVCTSGNTKSFIH